MLIINSSSSIYPLHSIQPQSDEGLPPPSDESISPTISGASLQDGTDSSMSTILQNWIVPDALHSTSVDNLDRVTSMSDPEGAIFPSTAATRLFVNQQDTSITLIRAPKDLEFDIPPLSSPHGRMSPVEFDFDEAAGDGSMAEMSLPPFNFSDTDDDGSSIQERSRSDEDVGRSQASGRLDTGPEISSDTSTFLRVRRPSVGDIQGISNESNAITMEGGPVVAGNTRNDSRGGFHSPYKAKTTAAKDRPIMDGHRINKRPRAHSKRGAAGSASNLYIAHEREKVLARNMNCPEDFLGSLTAQSRIHEMGLGDDLGTLRIMNFTVGSCETLVILVDVLRAFRRGAQSQFADAELDLSLAKRLQTIRYLNGSIAYHSLLRNLHILNFTPNKASRSSDRSGNFTIITAQSMAPQGRRPRGNPRNLAEAEMTKSILRDMHPDADENSSAYKRLYNEVKGLRKYSGRLSKLVEAFGLGILGLIPLVKNVHSASQAFDLTHQA